MRLHGGNAKTQRNCYNTIDSIPHFNIYTKHNKVKEKICISINMYSVARDNVCATLDLSSYI